MRQVMVCYKVKPERVEENEELVRAGYDELRPPSPPCIRYATFKLDEGVSFIHLGVTEAGSEGSQLSKLRAFQEFRKHIDGSKRVGLADDFSTRTRAGGSIGAPS